MLARLQMISINPVFYRNAINWSNIAKHLAIKHIIAVSGSSMMLKNLTAKKNWPAITHLSQQAIGFIKNLDKCT